MRAIVGEAQASRRDFEASEDDDALARHVANVRMALGFFGYAYYKKYAGSLKLVPIDAERGAGPIAPSETTIANDSYQPLTRPRFIT